MTTVNNQISWEIKLILTHCRKGIYSHLEAFVDVLFCCTQHRLALLLTKCRCRMCCAVQWEMQGYRLKFDLLRSSQVNQEMTQVIQGRAT
jgi:hypothetical protein